MKKWLILLVGFLLVLPMAHASEADLDVFADDNSACRLGVAEYKLEIENTGPVEDTYDISADLGCNCVQIEPDKVTLEPGETKEVYVWVNPETDIEPGTYDFNFYATSQTSDQRYSETATVEVLSCRDLDLNIVDSEKTSCRNETAEFQVEVENTGRETEDVTLSTEYGSFSQSKFSLNPDEKKMVTLRASNSKVESKDIQIKADSTCSYAESSQLVTLTTEKCYDSDISVSPTDKEVCAGLYEEWTVNIENKGTKADTFTLESNRGSFEQTTFELQPGETEQTTFSFKPSELREYNIELKVVSNVVSSQEIKVTGKDCKDVTVVTVPTVNQVCEDEMAEYDVKVENTGQVKDSYSLVSNLGTLDVNKLVLEPGESESVNLRVKAGSVETGRHRVKVRARSQTSHHEDYSEVELDAMNCYDLNLSMSSEDMTCNGVNATMFTLDLDNIGERDNTYQVELEGPEWLSYKPKEIEIPSKEQGKVYIYASAPYDVSGTFKINSTVTDQSGTVKREKDFQLNVKKVACEEDLPDDLPDEVTGRTILENSYRDLKRYLEDAQIPVELFFSIVAGIIISVAIILLETGRR